MSNKKLVFGQIPFNEIVINNKHNNKKFSITKSQIKKAFSDLPINFEYFAYGYKIDSKYIAQFENFKLNLKIKDRTFETLENYILSNNLNIEY